MTPSTTDQVVHSHGDGKFASRRVTQTPLWEGSTTRGPIGARVMKLARVRLTCTGLRKRRNGRRPGRETPLCLETESTPWPTLVSLSGRSHPGTRGHKSIEFWWTARRDTGSAACRSTVLTELNRSLLKYCPIDDSGRSTAVPEPPPPCWTASALGASTSARGVVRVPPCPPLPPTSPPCALSTASFRGSSLSRAARRSRLAGSWS